MAVEDTMSYATRILLAFGVASVAACGGAHSDDPTEAVASSGITASATLPASADARLEEKNPSQNYGNLSMQPNSGTLWVNGNVNGLCQLSEAALKFDVQGAAGKTITAARVRLYVTNTSTGRFELYRLGRDWGETTATWLQWASGQNWAAPGANGSGDRGPAIRGTIDAPTTSGYVDFALNAEGVALVQGWIDGTSANDGFLLRPTTSSPCTNAADDFAFASRETATPPKLVVDYAAQPAPPPPSSATIKIVTWNVEDGHFLSTAQDFLVAQKPQVAFLQEVDSPALVASVVAKLEADQGGTWYSKTICRGADSCSSNIAIVSKYPLASIGQLDLRTYGTYPISCVSSSPITWPGRRALGATINVNGRTLSVFSVRTSSDGGWDCVRSEEVTKLKAWAAANYPLPHVFGGDFNQQPDDASTAIMGADPTANTDAWAQAVGSGGAITSFATLDSTPDLYTPTRSSRLDYIFYTKGTPYLRPTRVDIVDSGGLSDHRPMEATFNVQ
jgi:endonuclease/exonuclease/phosphatase family metal-dependent hydrolase